MGPHRRCPRPPPPLLRKPAPNRPPLSPRCRPTCRPLPPHPKLPVAISHYKTHARNSLSIFSSIPRAPRTLSGSLHAAPFRRRSLATFGRPPAPLHRPRVSSLVQPASPPQGKARPPLLSPSPPPKSPLPPHTRATLAIRSLRPPFGATPGHLTPRHRLHRVRLTPPYPGRHSKPPETRRSSVPLACR